MAFEYQGAKDALKQWVNVYIPQEHGLDENHVFTEVPTTEEVSSYPILVVLNGRSVPSMSGGTISLAHNLLIGFVARAKDTRTAGRTLTAMLKAFDEAWLRDDTPLDRSFGNWYNRTQLNLPTEFDPVDRDDFGVITYQSTKLVVIYERIAGRDF